MDSYQNNKGGHRKCRKKKTKTSLSPSADSAQRLKELEEENYRLRMENDILIKFGRLRLEKRNLQTKNGRNKSIASVINII